jgi:hypothetical protein
MKFEMAVPAGFLMSVLSVTRGHQGSRQAPLGSGADTLILSQPIAANYLQ